MNCRKARASIGRYIDGSLGLVENALLRSHLSKCDRCLGEYERLEPARPLVARLPEARPSPNLELRILSAFSRVQLRRSKPSAKWNTRSVKIANWIRPVAVPGVGGLLIALILVPALLSAFWSEPVVHANDIPLRILARPLVTAPQMTAASPYPVSRDLIVVAFIDRRGAVYDYLVASDEPLDVRMQGQIANALLTSKFRPAERFGKPVSGERVILYQSVDSGA